MTRTEVLAWLDARQPSPPAALRARLAAAVTESEESLPEHFARLGRRLLARVAGQPDGGRDLALDLLAADALVTYAFEAQAEADIERLQSLADRIGGDRTMAENPV
ncbi:MAG: hypothetical protein ACREL9_04175 [Gemmatimonadales bacterium]